MYCRTAAEKLKDDEDRFFGHLATYVVAVLMLALMSISRALAFTSLAAVCIAWGAIVTAHGLRVYWRAHPA